MNPQLPTGNTCMSTENQFVFWGGYLCQMQINKVGVDTVTSTAHSFFKIIIYKKICEDNKGDFSQMLIYANGQNKTINVHGVESYKSTCRVEFIFCESYML